MNPLNKFFPLKIDWVKNIQKYCFLICLCVCLLFCHSVHLSIHPVSFFAFNHKNEKPQLLIESFFSWTLANSIFLKMWLCFSVTIHSKGLQAKRRGDITRETRAISFMLQWENDLESDSCRKESKSSSFQEKHLFFN